MHIKANANIGKFTNEQVEVPIQNYINELEESVDKSRKEHGQKPLKKFSVKCLRANAGYYTAPIAKGLEKLNVQGSIARRLGPKPKGIMSKLNFNYVEEFDLYICPENHQLTYKTTTRQGYKEYIGCNEV